MCRCFVCRPVSGWERLQAYCRCMVNKTTDYIPCRRKQHFRQSTLQGMVCKNLQTRGTYLRGIQGNSLWNKLSGRTDKNRLLADTGGNKKEQTGRLRGFCILILFQAFWAGYRRRHRMGLGCRQREFDCLCPCMVSII